MKDIVIIGAISFGKEVVALLEDNNSVNEEWNILGFVDDYLEIGSEFFGYPILGTVDWLIAQSEPIYAVIGIGSLAYREALVHRLDAVAHQITFPPLISHRATITEKSSLTLGEGTVVAQGAIIAVDVSIGRFCLINHQVVVGHDSMVGNFVTLNPQTCLSGFCVLEDSVDCGARVVVIPKKTIGHHAVLGAGAVVISDIPPCVTVVGNPSRVVKQQEERCENTMNLTNTKKQQKSQTSPPPPDKT